MTEARRTPRVITREQCEAAVDVPSLLDEIAAGFIAYSTGRVTVPPVGHLGFTAPPGDLHIKFGHVTGDASFVVKTASGFPGNADLGLPTGDGVMLVFARRTGLLEAVLLDGGWLTDLRTAAAGAVAARALAPARIERIGIVGAGVQGRLQLRLLARVTDCREVSVWSRTRAHADRLADEASRDGFRAEVLADADSVAASANLLVTTTASREALFDAGSVQPGTHVTAVGADAPGKRELDERLFARASVVVVDSRSQCAHHGELSHALAAGTVRIEQVQELGDVLASGDRARASDDAITICDLTGVAVQDIVIAQHVLRRVAGG